MCEAWGWTDGLGRRKDFAARSLLMKLEGRGQIRLPAPRMRRQRKWSWTANEPVETPAGPAWAATLDELRPVPVDRVEAGSGEYRRWNGYLTRHHYLGLRIVGENLGYLVRDRAGWDLACLLFGAPVWRCAPRDRFLDWSERSERADCAGSRTTRGSWSCRG